MLKFTITLVYLSLSYIFVSAIKLKTKTKIMKTATIQDFKVGNVLYMKNGGYSFSINEKYDDGIWNTREGKVIFESEYMHYDVKK